MTDKQFMLLQVNDAAFPIGAYAHSYGLETYIQEGLVRTAAEASRYIESNLRASFLFSELLAVKLAYCLAMDENLVGLEELSALLAASKTPREIRLASQKLGARFAKVVIVLLPPDAFFTRFAASMSKEKAGHAVLYGVFAACAGIAPDDALGAFLYAQTSAMVTCCVKTIPLSQTDGQRILVEVRANFGEILSALDGLCESDLCRACPGLAIRAMRHENLYSRLYMS
jgi:urease accessory protein